MPVGHWPDRLGLLPLSELWALCELEGTWLNRIQMYLAPHPESQRDGTYLQVVGSVNSDFFWCCTGADFSDLGLDSQLG